MPFKYVLLLFAGVYILTSLLGILIRCHQQGFKRPFWMYAVCAYIFAWIAALLAPLIVSFSILKGNYDGIQKMSDRIIWSIINIPVCLLTAIGAFHELIDLVIWKDAVEINNNIERIRKQKSAKSQGISAITLIRTLVERVVSGLHETMRVKYV